jgi:hypothetical protein
MTERLDVRIAAEYDCHPTWLKSQTGALANVSPRSLGISEHLARALERWATAFDATLDRDSPSESGFATKNERQIFSAWGEALAYLASYEMSQPIEYFDDNSGVYFVVSSHD